MSKTNLSNLWTRALTGAVFVSTIIGSILLNQILFAVLFLIVSIFSLYEFYHLLDSHKNSRPQIIPGLIAGSILYLLIVLVALGFAGTSLLSLAILLPVFIFIIELYRKKENPVFNIGITVLGLVYIVLPFAILNLFFNPEMMPGEYYPGLLIGFFVIIWAYDSFAYLTGMLLGRHRLFERISPKKSWEGSIGGFVFGLGAAVLIAGFYDVFSLLNWLVIAAIIMIFGTFGDLSESLLKRSLNIKDSGKVLPGHGGLLDRFDAVLLAAPAVFVYIKLIHLFS